MFHLLVTVIRIALIKVKLFPVVTLLKLSQSF